MLSMLLAVHRWFAALDIEQRLLCARGLRAPLDNDVHHAILGVLDAPVLRPSVLKLGILLQE